MGEIPQDVLALAEEAYQQAIYMTAADEPQNMVTMVARAILAERERAAKECDRIAGNVADFDERYRRGAGACSAAIRYSPSLVAGERRK